VDASLPAASHPSSKATYSSSLVGGWFTNYNNNSCTIPLWTISSLNQLSPTTGNPWTAPPTRNKTLFFGALVKLFLGAELWSHDFSPHNNPALAKSSQHILMIQMPQHLPEPIHQHSQQFPRISNNLIQTEEGHTYNYQCCTSSQRKQNTCRTQCRINP
jgi:hypothetical protein